MISNRIGSASIKLRKPKRSFTRGLENATKLASLVQDVGQQRVEGQA